MKKIVALVLGIIFASNFCASGFELRIKRDPFMNLLKYRELKMKEFMLAKENQRDFLQNEINFIKSSIKVKMVVTSVNDPSSKAALLVGPSGIPIVVVKGSKLKNGVFIKNITQNGVEVEIEHGNAKKMITLKIAK